MFLGLPNLDAVSGKPFLCLILKKSKMKNYLKATMLVLVLSSSLLSCTTNDVTEGDIIPEVNDEQATRGKGQVREKPTD